MDSTLQLDTGFDYDGMVDFALKAEHAYWVLNSPIMADSFFDHILQQIQCHEARTGYVRPDSPTRRIGGKLLDGFSEYLHVSPMQSLEKVFTIEDLHSTLEKLQAQLTPPVAWMVQPKVDGASIDLRYEKGVLVRALTRGNGESGSDVTDNIKTIRTVPLQLQRIAGQPIPEVLHVRGEIYITFEEFKRLNDRRVNSGEPKLANPRNAAAGAIQTLNPKDCASKPLRFMPYSIAHCSDSPDQLTGEAAMIELLCLWGFQRMPAVVLCRDPLMVMDAVSKFEAVRKHLDFPTDGAVIKIEQFKHREVLGIGTQAPKWATAYKYAAEEVETQLIGVTFQVGKTGVITPVAELEPVLVSGSTVSRATLHNEQRILDLKLRIGDTVVIRKAGEIIPELVRRVGDNENVKPIVWPSVCPSCQVPLAKVKRADGSEGAAWICEVETCPDQLKGRLAHWCSRNAMSIDDIGPETISKIFYRVKTVDQLYEPSTLHVLQEAVGMTMATKIWTQIDASRTAGMEKILYGLCIPSLGERASKKLARHIPDLETFAKMQPSAFEQIPELGESMIGDILRWQSVTQNHLIMEGLKANGVDTQSKTYNPGAVEGPLKGMTFVITGDLDTMERSKAHAAIEARGGRATGSVSKKTTYLVVGREPGNNKLMGARKHGTKMLTEPEFLKILEES